MWYTVIGDYNYWFVCLLGTPNHVETSWKAFESVFTLFNEKDDELEVIEQKEITHSVCI